MAEESSEQSRVVALNDVINLLGALRAGDIRSIISGGTVALKDCDVRCGCNTLDCACNNIVRTAVVGEISLPDVQRLREQRLTELRRQLREVEEGGPKGGPQ